MKIVIGVEHITDWGDVTSVERASRGERAVDRLSNESLSWRSYA